jgi:uncharacterized protein YbjT (DUF2867 family)
MKNHTKIAFIGATGRLGLPVAQKMVQKGFSVRAISRNALLARTKLPESIEIVQANLDDINSLIKAFKGCHVVYINLSTETLNPKLSFYEEREGIKNIVEAAELSGIEQIIKISALGAYPLATHLKTYFFPNEMKRQGHQFIEKSSIPFTIFHPSSFEDSLLFNVKNNTIQWIGKPVAQYWTNLEDYSNFVIAAIENPKAFNQHYAVQGQKLQTYEDIFAKFKKQNPTLKIQVTPLWMIKFLSIFSSKFKVLASLFSYFENDKEHYYAEHTWADLSDGQELISSLRS